MTRSGEGQSIALPPLPCICRVEEGVRPDGLLEKGFDWYVQTVKLDPASLNTPVFNGVLASWKAKLSQVQANTPSPPTNLSEMTIAQILGGLKAGQLWSLLVALAAVIAGAFALGSKLIGS